MTILGLDDQDILNIYLFKNSFRVHPMFHLQPQKFQYFDNFEWEQSHIIQNVK